MKTRIKVLKLYNGETKYQAQTRILFIWRDLGGRSCTTVEEAQGAIDYFLRIMKDFEGKRIKETSIL